MKTIKVNHSARVEGDGGITVEFDGNKLTKVNVDDRSNNFTICTGGPGLGVGYNPHVLRRYHMYRCMLVLPSGSEFV